ncbi:MAG: J domain-containing protein [Chloroflexota bacterium]|nr:J domain-containing protein [Chloroflexota bacterium]
MEFDQSTSGGFSDFFQTLFAGAANGRGSRTGAASRRSVRQRGEDIEVAVSVSFDEAFRGALRELRLQSTEKCPTCDGTSFAREAPCPTCDGRGIRARAKTIEVRIPPGVATGSRVRVAGEGGTGLGGGPAGDVYLRVTVESHPRFERAGDNLRSEIEVSLYTAILGGEVVATTPTGQVQLAIPANTQPGRLIRLRGQGMPKLKAGTDERGDLLLRVKIVLPADLTDEERELFSRLRDLRSEQSI